MCNLSSIEKICGGTIGGLVEINLIDPEDILVLPNPGCQATYTGEIMLKPGKSMYRIYFQKQSAVFTEKSNKTSKNGDYFEQELAFSVIKDRVSVANLIQRMANKRVHVLLKYTDGTQKLILNARCVTDHTSGQRRIDKVATRFIFNSITIRRALMIIPIVTDALRAFSDGFSNGFS